MTLHYRIAVTGTPLPPLTYASATPLMIGIRVLVPLGNRIQVGLVLAEDTQPNHDFAIKDVIQALDQQPLWNSEEIALLDWCSRYYHATWGSLLDTALAPSLKKPPSRNPRRLKRPEPTQAAPLQLNAQQADIATTIKHQFGRFSVHLIEGVTGSGKTEVYVDLIQQTLMTGKQALLLVPEIGLTPQMVERLTQRLGQAPLLLHSNVADGQRGKVWLYCQQGTPLLLVGTRSAVFAPLPKLGLIIVDEEHDSAYKQQDGIRYHARDVAIMRSKLQDCPIVLGSATPSLESLYNVVQGHYHWHQLTLRANAKPLPPIQLIDIRQQPLTAGLSPALIQKIQATLDNNEQVLLFLNRRGYAPVLMCHDCGHTLDCQACDAPFTFHRQSPHLRCHHCGRVEYQQPNSCPHCGAQHWQLVGQGTQQLEEALYGLFPHTTITRLDRDSLTQKDSLSIQLQQAKQNTQGQILLGTQLLAKGHDISGITLVGIVDVDGALFARDFRALERLAQLVTQVAGRAGRGDKSGEVYLQTHHPQHPFVQSLLSQTYHQIAQDLLVERRQAQLPPVTFSAYLLVEGKKLQAVQQQCRQLLENAVLPDTVQLAGPIPALMHKRQHHYRELLWLQSTNRRQLHQAIHHLLDLLNLPRVRMTGVTVRWDIDPQDMP